MAANEAIVVSEPPRFVGRGGLKLEAALAAFGLDVGGKLVLDAGSSTGGFCDCLLQHGARHVVCVDVGRGILHERLRRDPRVSALEGFNVRHLDLDSLIGRVKDRCPGAPTPPVDLVTADLSFISLTSVARVLASYCRPGGDVVVLVKPQFEAGRQVASRARGVIRDPGAWSEAICGASGALEDAGTGIMCAMASPLSGPAGNREFFVHARKGAAPRGPAALAELALAVAQAAAESTA